MPHLRVTLSSEATREGDVIPGANRDRLSNATGIAFSVAAAVTELGVIDPPPLLSSVSAPPVKMIELVALVTAPVASAPARTVIFPL